jgi:hypothetical protein
MSAPSAVWVVECAWSVKTHSRDRWQPVAFFTTRKEAREFQGGRTWKFWRIRKYVPASRAKGRAR